MLRLGALESRCAVRFATEDITAKARSDYSAASGVLSFGPGERCKTITISLVDDTRWEPDETFAINLSDATAPASLAPPRR